MVQVFHAPLLLVVWCFYGRSLFMGEATFSKPRNRKLETSNCEAVVRRELEAIIIFLRGPGAAEHSSRPFFLFFDLQILDVISDER